MYNKIYTKAYAFIENFNETLCLMKVQITFKIHFSGSVFFFTKAVLKRINLSQQKIFLKPFIKIMALFQKSKMHFSQE